MSTKPGREVAYKADRHAAVGYYTVPTTPEVDQLEVDNSLVALGQPSHHMGPFRVDGFACATSPMVLDQQQS